MTEPRNPVSLFSKMALAIAEYLRRLEDGERIDIEEFARDYPLVRDELCHALEEVRQVRERTHAGARTASEAGLDLPNLDPSHLSEEDSSRDLRSFLEDLRRRTSADDRYETRDEIGRGGMGIVHKVWDRALRRSLAMKVLKREFTGPDLLGSPGSPRALGRFIEEAQIAAQLDHPGLATVHELGIDTSGRVFFTMKLVRGETLARVFEKVREQTDGWNPTRALGVILKVCEALAFAHSRGVIHRDMKPANIMIGRFGETYVMDWGLARLLKREASPADSTTPGTLESPLSTHEGDVLGTPLYMSPEQAHGDLQHIGPQSDVYSVGAILYQLIAGHAPYTHDGDSSTAREILERLQRGPPPELHDKGDAAPELVAICEKAMARELGDRYAAMEEMAEDLRAYLEDRVVRAHRTGAIAEFKKWVSRNRMTASVLAILMVVLFGSSIAVAWKEQQRANEASLRRQEALQSQAALQRQTDFLLAPALLESARDLGPIRPVSASRYREWLGSVDELAQRAPAYAAELAEIRENGTPVPDSELSREPDHEQLVFWEELLEKGEMVVARETEKLGKPELGSEVLDAAMHQIGILRPEAEVRKRKIASLRHRIARDRPYRLATAELQMRHDELAALVRHLDDLTHSQFGIRQEIEVDLERALALAQESTGAHGEKWAEAVQSIASEQECPLYGGLKLAPQLGLVPIRRDEASGLWDFLHVLSGHSPHIDREGQYVLESGTGIILTLVPGGTAWVGAQLQAPDKPYFDPDRRARETPLHTAELDPYFLSKYELTQGQWTRSGEENPSQIFAGNHYRDFGAVSHTHPLEHAAWIQVLRMLTRWSLTLPTEAQWEYAARAGTDTPFWSGRDYETIKTRVNLADLTLERLGFLQTTDTTVEDGYPFHAPVDSFGPNPWGFHGVCGNVQEWCLDAYSTTYEDVVVTPHSGEHMATDRRFRCVRGGSFKKVAVALRMSERIGFYPSDAFEDLGARPCRALDTPGVDR